MPNRILREGILTSERVNALGWAEEVFYRRLMSVVDDFGRYHANAKLIRAACYPLALDKVSDADVEKWLLATEKAALISVYPAEDGKRYLELIDFRQQARAKASKFPQLTGRCVADATQTSSRSVAHAPVGGGGDGDECEDGGEVVGGGPTDLPDDEAWLANLQLQFADRDVAGERVSFMAFCQRKGTAANRSGFVGWLRKASPKLQPAKVEEVEQW